MKTLYRIALLALTGTLCGCGSIEPGIIGETHATWGGRNVRVWLSTADRREQLTRNADLLLHDAAAVPATIEIDPSRRYQTIVGFGAAITDTSAWLIQTRLNAAQRAALLKELFGPDPGLRISLIRLTIGASDFSLTHYSFDDMPSGEADPGLAHFSIAPIRDTVLPVVRAARLLNPALRVIASPWSAPGWMKTSGGLLHGTLAPQHYGAFADYLVKYIEEMQAHGVPIFALTLQNEPHFDPLTYPGMLLSATARGQLIGQYLGPALARRKAASLILDWDHNWDRPQEPLQVLDDSVAAPYVAGVAWHCYAGKIAAQVQVHLAHPDKDTYLTECSSGNWGTNPDSSLLSMTREQIIASTRGWARGVLFWNLALDETAGPHLGGCRGCRGLVTIDSRTGQLTRTDDYYAIAHVSRFVLQGAEHIESNATDAGLANVAFRNPQDGSIVLLAANSANDPRTMSVRCQDRAFDYTMPPQSVATFVWGGLPTNR
jgi:glucosylceramidase